MTTTLKFARYCTLVAQVGFWVAAFWTLCLVSAECRRIRAGLRAEGECIEPLKPVIEHLEVLHVELFGDDFDDE